MSIAPNDSNIVYSPYNWEVSASYAGTICPGAYFSVLVNGSFSAAALNFDATHQVGDAPQIWWRVDQGVWTKAVIGTPGVFDITSALDSNWPRHYIEVIVKSYPAFQDRWSTDTQLIRFTGISTTPDTATTLPITTRPLNVIIYGDSITEGIATIHAIGATVPEADAYDCLQCYSYLLRDAIGCEVGVVGFAGQGWTLAGVNGSPAFPASWQLMRAGVSRSFATAPDLIVLNEGTNDGGSNIVATAVSVINSMLTLMPATTKIAVLRPFGGNQAANLQAAVAACASPQRVSYVDTTGWWTNTDSSDFTHPWGYAHQLIARSAGSSLRSVLRRGSTYLNVAGVAKAISTVRI